VNGGWVTAGSRPMNAPTILGQCAHCDEPLYMNGPVCVRPLSHVGCALLAAKVAVAA
jgi:hypothetical protein